VDSGFWAWCVGCSIIVHYLIDRPCRTKQWVKGSCGILLTSFIIFTLGQYAHVNLQVGADSKIALLAPDDMASQRWINPYIVWHDGNLVVSARRLKQSSIYDQCNDKHCISRESSKW
jgi:hypothetical protein